MAVDPLLCSREDLLVLLADQAVVIEELKMLVAGQTVAHLCRWPVDGRDLVR